ncbi:hypothetical protein EDD16DRAFT_1550587 [Pisolithus croceorrhizus]|nr:hypothetical protein EDD16DRAFT_1550587 [Pisolithus croceorrhizus]KAI6150055.1 hypothetical protein EDD17DRAFT_1640524 [Pisolithus thermaeus]
MKDFMPMFQMHHLLTVARLLHGGMPSTAAAAAANSNFGLPVLAVATASYLPSLPVLPPSSPCAPSFVLATPRILLPQLILRPTRFTHGTTLSPSEILQRARCTLLSAPDTIVRTNESQQVLSVRCRLRPAQGCACSLMQTNLLHLGIYVFDIPKSLSGKTLGQ